MRLVQTVKSNTLYGGNTTAQLCSEHSNQLQMIIEQNAANGCHFGYNFEPLDDWHYGECKHEKEHK